MNKTTDELINILKLNQDIETFLSENNDEFLNTKLCEYLSELLIQKNLTKQHVIAQSGLNQIYAYQIFSGKKNPSRDKVICIAFGMKLSFDETQRLLKVAEVSVLYPRIKRDSVIIFALNKRITIMECDELLYDLDEYVLQ